MKTKRNLARFLAAVMIIGIISAGLVFAPVPAFAAPAASLAAQIGNIGGLTADLSPTDPNTIDVSGSAAGIKSTVSLNIDPDVTVNWGANLTGDTPSGRYLLNLSGGGAFNLVGGAAVENGSGIITVTGNGTNVSINSGSLSTPETGNGISVNIAAGNVTLNVNDGGEICNEGTNSAVNVTAGVTGVKINCNGGTVKSYPAGYAVSDGGTSDCVNDTRITVNGGTVAAGSACAVKSTGAGSVITVLSGTVTNEATVNSNPVIYMNGGTGDNVIIGGDGQVIASDNSLGYGVQTTGNVLIRDNAQVKATLGRAVNLVGMNSQITVNGGLVTAATGVAVCTATTNPATVANTKIIINGGVVSATGNDAHGSCRAIMATGQFSEVVVNGGWVSTSANAAEAIYSAGSDSSVLVTGGLVTALDHFAIEAYSGGSVAVSGGFVFSYGTAPLSYKTGANVLTSSVGAITPDRITVSGGGIAAVWDHGAGRTVYTEGDATHLVTEPSPLSVYWHSNGGRPDDGIYYSNNGNAGFFPLPEVEVDLPEPVKHEVTVQYGKGSGLYQAGVTVGVTADPPAGGLEFDCWDVTGNAVPEDIHNAVTTFVMPDNDVALEATYRNRMYTLTVSGGTGGGSYAAGETVTVTAAGAPLYQVFDHWETESGGGSFASAFSPMTEFTMPAGDAAVTAAYRDVPLYAFILEGGTVVSSDFFPVDGKYPAGAVITVRAPGDLPDGYEFGGWYIVGGGGSFDDAFSLVTGFTMPAADTVVSVNPPYSADSPEFYTLTVINGEDVTGGGPYSAGDMVSIAADPTPFGKVFAGWRIAGGAGTFGDAGETETFFRMSDADAAVRAEYTDAEYPLFVEGGEITGGAYGGTNNGQFITGEKILLTAAEPGPETKYRFDGWSVSGGGSFDDGSGPSAGFTMPMGAAVVTAHWIPLHQLTVEGGTTADGGGSGYFEEGAVIEIAKDGAVPADYEFAGWHSHGGGGFGDAASAATTFTMPPNDVTVTADYVYHQAAVTGVLTVERGSGGGSYAAGTPVTITADPPGTNEVFDRWVSDAADGGTLHTLGGPNLNYGSFADAFSPETGFTMPDQSVIVTAMYKTLYTLTVSGGSGGGSYAAGTSVTVTAGDAPSGKTFDRWTGGDGSLANARAISTVFVMPAADTAVTAVYEDIEHPLYSLTTVSCHSNNHGPFEGNGSESVTVTADMPQGRVFAGWTVTGVAYGGSFTDPAPVTFIMPAGNVTVTATFRDAEPDPTPTPGPAPTPGPTPAPAPKPASADVSHMLNTEVHMAYVTGVGKNMFAPDRPITRAETAQMFYNLLIDKNIQKTKSFPDVPENAYFKKAVDTLASLGVIAGYPDGRFYPDHPITRAEFVSIAVRFTKETLGNLPPTVFTDVPKTHWAYGYIVTAESYGWIHGVGGGHFEPDRHINRAEAVTLVNRMLRRNPDKAYIDSHSGLVIYTDTPKSHWAFYDIMEASNAHDYVRREDGESEEWTHLK
ncbi:MAG: S-layer homology domain-containing protein [Oscillospiraceae bacterium]|jgi:hypothetical protein|nr:S-layer homology domain-containing protein [Oscillospiraceae bacterium]